MSESRAAIRYAKALLELSVEKKSTEALEADMRTVLDTLNDSTELQEVLADPVINGSAKQQVLESVFKGSQQGTLDLIKLLVNNKRVGLLAQVAQKFIALSEALRGEEAATVTTAVTLTADMEKQVLAKVAELTGKKVSLKSVVDPAVLGGFILRVGDTQYDASIANKLSEVKRSFVNSI